MPVRLFIRANLLLLVIRCYAGAVSIDMEQLLTQDYTKTISLIEKDTETSWETKQRQRASCDEVLKFCNNKTDCRRVQVLSFFSETFDPADCHLGCDICLTRDQNTYQDEDVTSDSQIILQMMQSFPPKERITFTNLVDCFRGKMAGTKGIGQNPFFGVGRQWSKEDAARLVQLLVVEGGLGEYNVVNKSGWSNSYLRVSRAGPGMQNTERGYDR
jgi:bloom syndrome protein